MSRIAPSAAIDVNDIVSRSVSNSRADWSAAPQFNFRESDVIVKGGQRTVRTYQVLMIDGTPYNKLIAENGKPLSAGAAASEEQKLQRETRSRGSESSGARQKRIAEYQRERRQDHELMMEMINAFHFQLAGTETLNGRECYRIDATPKPGYVPKSRETKVLTGMRGTLWIDTKEYQWVKVTASVFRPVSFGLFIAQVRPGTEFTLEQMPVEGSIWLPSHFTTRVNAKVLLWSHTSLDDETYSNYHRNAAQTTAKR